MYIAEKTHTSFDKTFNILSRRFTDFFLSLAFFPSADCMSPFLSAPLCSWGTCDIVSNFALLALARCVLCFGANSREKCRLFCSALCCIHATFLHISTFFSSSFGLDFGSREHFFRSFSLFICHLCSFEWHLLKKNFRRFFLSRDERVCNSEKRIS